MMPSINFSEQWDKLQPQRMAPGMEFTTFRGYEPRKETYYIKNVMKVFTVKLNRMAVGKARLRSVRGMRASCLTNQQIKDDTYQDWEALDFALGMKKFYDNPDPYGLLLTFVWEE
jgi:hypothetical protein